MPIAGLSFAGGVTMSISKSKSVALIMPTAEEIQTYTLALNECGLPRIVAFQSAEEALDVSKKQLFDLFVTSMELPKMSGIVFIQKLRSTGNYGNENHLFVCNSISNDLMALLIDLQITHVLKRPLTKASLAQKIHFILKSERELSKDESMFRDARAAYINGIDEMALETAERALRLNPNLEKAQLLIGDIYIRQAKLSEAKAVFEKVVETNPMSLAASHRLAKIAMLEHKPAEAALQLVRMADLNPYHIRILEDAGVSSLEAEHYDDAKKYMGKLIAIDETNQKASAVVAEVMVRLGDYEGIIATLSKAHSEKEVIQFLNNAGIKLSKENDAAGALKMYKTAVLQLEGKTQLLYAIYYNMGLAYKKLNDKVNAIVCFKQALKINPKFEKAQHALAEYEKAS